MAVCIYSCCCGCKLAEGHECTLCVLHVYCMCTTLRTACVPHTIISACVLLCKYIQVSRTHHHVISVQAFWLDSILLQLGEKTDRHDRVALMDVMMTLITRKIGIASMSEEDREAYLSSVRSSGASLLGMWQISLSHLLSLD